MPIDISTFEEMERRISSAGPDELLEIKIELGRRLSDIGRVRKENEDAAAAARRRVGVSPRS